MMRDEGAAAMFWRSRRRTTFTCTRGTLLRRSVLLRYIPGMLLVKQSREYFSKAPTLFDRASVVLRSTVTILILEVIKLGMCRNYHDCFVNGHKESITCNLFVIDTSKIRYYTNKTLRHSAWGGIKQLEQPTGQLTNISRSWEEIINSYYLVH